MAQVWSENSYAKRLKVGALIVKDQMIISDGYNGTPKGFKNECEYIEYQRKSHPYFPGIEADTEGNIFKNGEPISKWLHPSGKYQCCRIMGLQIKVPHVIMRTFVNNPDPDFYTQINHINYNVEDNRLINLEWCSNRYNSIHRSQRMENTCEHPGVSFNSVDPRDFQTIKYTEIKTHPYVLHAEANAITKVAQSTNSSKDATLYTLVSPCMECAKLIIQAGIKRVVYAEEYRITGGDRLIETSRNCC